MDFVELRRRLAAGEDANQRTVRVDEVVRREFGPPSAGETDEEVTAVARERAGRVFGHLGSYRVVDHVDTVAAGCCAQRGCEWSVSVVDRDFRAELPTEV